MLLFWVLPFLWDIKLPGILDLMVNFNTCHHVKQHVKHRGVFWRKQFQGREGWGCSLPLYLAMPLQKKTIVMSSISPTLSLWSVPLWTYRVRYEIAAFISETKRNYVENKHLCECSQCRDVTQARCYSAASVGRVGLERAWSVPALNEVPISPLSGMLVRLVTPPPPSILSVANDPDHSIGSPTRQPLSHRISHMYLYKYNSWAI